MSKLISKRIISLLIVLLMCLSALLIFESAATAETLLLGDVNSDGKVDSRDRAALTRYLAKWKGYESIDVEASDLNADGKVNALDRVILTRHLAKWNGYDILPYAPHVVLFCVHCDATGVCPDCEGEGCHTCPETEICKRCTGHGITGCPNCYGEGIIECPSLCSRGKCESCFGTGWRIDECGCGGDEECPDCGGTDVYSSKCIACKGTGICTGCNGMGSRKCEKCNGSGDDICPVCEGAKYLTCSKCEGSGKLICNTCNGDKKCQRCEGKGYIVKYI